jgi:hypothetical protein
MGLSKVFGNRCLVASAVALALRPLPARDVGDCGDHFSGHQVRFIPGLAQHGVQELEIARGK